MSEQTAYGMLTSRILKDHVSSCAPLRSCVVGKDTTVELRKSCDYCVRLKRACDGKNPCTLCSRRKKPCTRSARKKSGPAKGTKYAPRRKRSPISEWADRASVGVGVGVGTGGVAGEVRQVQDSNPASNIGGVEGATTSAGPGAGASSREICQAPILPSSSPLFLDSRVAQSARRQSGGIGSDAGDPGKASLAGGGKVGDPGSHVPLTKTAEATVSLGSSEQAQKQQSQQKHQEGSGSSAGETGVSRGRQQGMGDLNPLPTSSPLEREQGASSSWGPWGPNASGRSGFPRLEAAAAAAVEAAAAAAGRGAMSRTAGLGGGVPELRPKQEPPDVYMPVGAAGPLPPPVPNSIVESDPRRGQGRELPTEWASPREMVMETPGLSHRPRIRLSPPSVPIESRNIGRGSDTSRVVAPSNPQEQQLGGSAGEPESSPAFRPLPREPPDPTAGFAFRPLTQRLSWRRSPHSLASWDTRPGDLAGMVPPRVRSPPRQSGATSLERGGPGSSGEAGVGGQDLSGRRGGESTHQDDLEWPRHSLPYPHSFDEIHQREWTGGAGGGDVGGSRRDLGGNQSDSKFLAAAAMERRRQAEMELAGSLKRPRVHHGADDRPSSVIMGGVGRMGAVGGSFVGGGSTSGSAGGSMVGSASGSGPRSASGNASASANPGNYGGSFVVDGPSRDSRAREPERQSLEVRHQDRHGWEYDYRGIRVSSQVMAGDSSAEARSEEHQTRHQEGAVGSVAGGISGTSGAGGSHGGGGTAGWGPNRDDRGIMGSGAKSVRGAMASLTVEAVASGVGGERSVGGSAGTSAAAVSIGATGIASPSAVRASLESEVPGNTSGSPASRSLRAPSSAGEGAEDWRGHGGGLQDMSSLPPALPRIRALAGVESAGGSESQAPHRPDSAGGWASSWGAGAGSQTRRSSGPGRDAKVEGMDEAD